MRTKKRSIYRENGDIGFGAELGFGMASSSRKDYEIISDPFDPRCVIATFKALFGEVTEEDKLLLERIRGKEDNTSPKYTDQEERNLINKQIRKSQVSLSLDLVLSLLFSLIRLDGGY